MGGEIKIMNVEDSFRKLDEEGKEKVAIIYLREKKIGVQILRLGRLMQVCKEPEEREKYNGLQRRLEELQLGVNG